MINNLIVGVTTVAFSKNEQLISHLNNFGFKQILINTPLKRFSKTELINFLSKCDIAIVGLDIIDESVLSSLPKLKAISKYGVGLDNIDLEACNKYKVQVLHTQGINKRSVSELVLGSMLSLIRNIYVSSNLLKNNIWQKDGGTQLSNKTIGIIGVGNVGKDLIQLLKPFNCKILVNDIINQNEYYQNNNLIETSKEKIFKEADVITIHTPLDTTTKYLINIKSLKMMKPTTLIINTARGGIVNQDDLKWALKNNIIAGAAIDAYEIEPPEDKELLSFQNLINTPHIVGNAEEAVLAMGLASITNIIEWTKEK